MNYYKMIKKLTIILLTTLFISSCVENITLKTDSTSNRLVVEGYLTSDTTAQKVILTKSGDVENRNPKEYITNATVFITDSLDTFKLKYSGNKGIYLTKPDVFGIPGHTYTLHISNIDVNDDGVMENYTASSSMKNELPIDSFKFTSQSFGKDIKMWTINLFAKDIGNGRNYYLFKVYKNDTLLTDSIKEFSIGNNAGFEGQYYNGYTVYSLGSWKNEILRTGDTVTLEMAAITEDYFNFITGFISEYYPKNPIFSGPSANVLTNVLPKNTGVGYFTAYTVKRKTAIYK